MDYKLNRENFTVSQTLFDSTVQQSAELDYILPDYYPEIFKVLSIKIIPSIAKRSLNGTKLDYELCAKVRLVYVSESGEMSAVEQVLSYGKSVELAQAAKSTRIVITPYTESASCRVVNKRRVDIRGIVSIAISATADDMMQAVSDAYGGGIQLKKTLLTYPAKRISVTKKVTVVDEVELGLSKPAVKTVLRADAYVGTADKKILSGKLLTKGEAIISLLYIPEDSDDPESIKFSVPFSQISDIEGLDERYDVILDASVCDCDIKPAQSEGNPTVSCELSIEINCLAMRFDSRELASDAYSTQYEAIPEMSEAQIECVPVPINESIKSKASLTYYDGEISSVISAGAELGRITAEANASGETVLNGRITFYAYAKNEAGKPIYLEVSDRISLALPGKSVGASRSCAVSAYVDSAAFNLSSSNAMEITADVKLSGHLFETSSLSFISSITLDETKPIESGKDAAIKLYYAEKGEEPWLIAKRCHASLAAITEENELDTVRLEEAKMILIPIVD